MPIITLHRMHKMQTIVTDVRSVCLSVCLNVCRSVRQVAQLGFTMQKTAEQFKIQNFVWGEYSWAAQLGTLC